MFIAQAVRRLVGVEDVRIFKSRAFVKLNGTWFRYIVPPAVYREITAFDRGAAFEPGEYYLRPPSKNERLGTHQDWQERKRRAQVKSKKTRLVGDKTKNVRPDSDPSLVDLFRPAKPPESHAAHLPPHIREAANHG